MPVGNDKHANGNVLIKERVIRRCEREKNPAEFVMFGSVCPSHDSIDGRGYGALLQRLFFTVGNDDMFGDKV
jgi:hypothetical protein